MFKIVETIERGSKKLTIIPWKWETNGDLAWPKYKADKLILIADSVPEDSWFKMKCKLKRSHLVNRDVAEEELERMLDRDDTEQEYEIENGTERRKRPRVMLPKRNVPIFDDFNSLASTCSVTDKVLPETPKAKRGVKVISQTIFNPKDSLQFENVQEEPLTICNSVPDAENSYILLPNSSSAISNNNESFIDNSLTTYFQTTEGPTSDRLTEKLDNILANQAIIIDNQNEIIEKFKNVASTENQILIIQQLAKFEAMIDSVGNKISNISSSSLTLDKRTEQDTAVMEPIETLDDLEKFERKLADKKEMDIIVQKLTFICGKKGSGKGINNCYSLVDRMFSRKFMTLCSWAGGGRDKKEKIPFKFFKNVINLFFRVVHLSDVDFTLRDCEEFFKNVIRNSTRRNESGMIRSSATKRRPKNLSYKIEENSQVKSVNNDNNEIVENERNVSVMQEGTEKNKNHEDKTAVLEEDAVDADIEDDSSNN